MNICERHENAIVVYDYPNRECPYCRDQEEFKENNDWAERYEDLEMEKDDEIDSVKDDLRETESKVEELEAKIEELEEKIEELKHNAQNP